MGDHAACAACSVGSMPLLLLLLRAPAGPQRLDNGHDLFTDMCRGFETPDDEAEAAEEDETPANYCEAKGALPSVPSMPAWPPLGGWGVAGVNDML